MLNCLIRSVMISNPGYYLAISEDQFHVLGVDIYIEFEPECDPQPLTYKYLPVHIAIRLLNYSIYPPGTQYPVTQIQNRHIYIITSAKHSGYLHPVRQGYLHPQIRQRSTYGHD